MENDNNYEYVCKTYYRFDDEDIQWMFELRTNGCDSESSDDEYFDIFCRHVFFECNDCLNQYRNKLKLEIELAYYDGKKGYEEQIKNISSELVKIQNYGGYIC